MQIAENRAPKVRETIEKLRRARENEKLLSSLAVRVEQGHLTQAEVLEAVCGASKPAQTRDEPWVVTFGVNFGEPLPEGVPERDPQLSDWLIERLERDLTGTGAIFQFIDDERSGETTSVRCAFWVFDFDRIQEQIDFCWDILEVQMYSEVFGDMPDDL